MPKLESKQGILALMLGHCAGMVDLIALPIWMGTLITTYGFDAIRAGALVTLFLLGAITANMCFKPLFQRLNARLFVIIGFICAGLSFYYSAQNTHFEILAILHILSGCSIGMALSITHSTIERSCNPHRLFGFSGLALGIFGFLFLVFTVYTIKDSGGSAFFYILSALMLSVALCAFSCFPTMNKTKNYTIYSAETPISSIPIYMWLGITGIVLLAMTQSLTMSFYERIGIARGFSTDDVTITLIIYGVMCLFPAPAAALLKNKLNAIRVLCIVPVFQAIFSLCMTQTHNYVLYTLAGALMSCTILFTHTFAFGLLAKIDPTGRAVAGTPAMLMLGSAIGPLLGGSLVHFFSFSAIGYMASLLVIGQLIVFRQLRKKIHAQDLAKNTIIHPVSF